MLKHQPNNIKIDLFPHQLSSIYNMEKLELNNKIEVDNLIKETKIGINADHTGYGKTLSMLGLIARDKLEWDLTIPFISNSTIYDSSELIKTNKIERKQKIMTNLILAPTSIIKQWFSEIKKYTQLTVEIINSVKELNNVIVENYDIIIVSVNMYNNLVIKYKDYCWKRFIFDEPGHSRVVNMKKINAGFYWLVTATPNSIISKHINCKNSFMKKIIEDCYPYDIQEKFNGMIIKNDIDFIKSSFNMPNIIYFNYNCFQPVILKTISTLVNDNINLMIKAGNIEGAILALGGTKSNNIIEIVRNKKIEELEIIKSKITIYNLRNDKIKVQDFNNKKEHIENQIQEITHKFADILNIKCNICMDIIKKPILEPYCQNIFCGECLLTWLKTKDNCPLCRHSIDNTELVLIEKNDTQNDTQNNTQNDTQKKKRKLTKNETIIDILLKNKKGKFLIFSSFDESFKTIHNLFIEKNISYTFLKGNINNSEKIIQQYKTGNIQVILLNSNFNGAGINLQETTDIILYHEMDNMLKTQVLGRAQRIGRKVQLKVHQLYN